MSQALNEWLDNPPLVAEQRKSSLPVWGVIGGFLLPIAGIVIAIVLFTRGQVGPGLAACLASFVGLFLSLALLGA